MLSLPRHVCFLLASLAAPMTTTVALQVPWRSNAAELRRTSPTVPHRQERGGTATSPRGARDAGPWSLVCSAHLSFPRSFRSVTPSVVRFVIPSPGPPDQDADVFQAAEAVRVSRRACYQKGNARMLVALNGTLVCAQCHFDGLRGQNLTGKCDRAGVSWRRSPLLVSLSMLLPTLGSGPTRRRCLEVRQKSRVRVIANRRGVADCRTVPRWKARQPTLTHWVAYAALASFFLNSATPRTCVCASSGVMQDANLHLASGHLAVRRSNLRSPLLTPPSMPSHIEQPWSPIILSRPATGAALTMVTGNVANLPPRCAVWPRRDAIQTFIDPPPWSFRICFLYLATFASSSRRFLLH